MEVRIKKIAVITMARNDEFFLNRWVQYYGKQFGEENLYIYLDGLDQKVPAFAAKTNIKVLPRTKGKIVAADRDRIKRINQEAKQILQKYDLIIGTDADEFLVVEPNCGKNLAEYLSSINIKTTVSGLGIDVGQKLNEEQELNKELPFLLQRSYAYLSSRYTKASVKVKSKNWGAGFHRLTGSNFTIDKNLYLFHFGSVDAKIIESKISDKDKIKTGWTRHLKKRMRVINYVSTKKVRNWNKFLPITRTIQTIFRPIYAWNKPSMLGMRWIVKLPERFKNIGI
jgi:hypothetical protein